jgi:hypothetical protein
MGFLKSKRFWLNAASAGLWIGKGLGFDVPVDPDPAVVAVLTVVLGIIRSRFGV